MLGCQPFWHRRRREEGKERSWACCCCCYKGWDGWARESTLVGTAAVSPDTLAASQASWRQGMGEVGSRNKADLLLFVLFFCCLPLELFPSSMFWIVTEGAFVVENMSMDCHLQYAAWPAFQDLCRAATAMVHVRSPGLVRGVLPSQTLKSPCEWFAAKCSLIILPRAKEKLREEQKMRDVSEYNSHVTSAMFFFLALWRWRYLLFLSQHLFWSQCLTRLLKYLLNDSLSVVH